MLAAFNSSRKQSSLLAPSPPKPQIHPEGWLCFGGDGENDPDGHQAIFVRLATPNLAGAAGHASTVVLANAPCDMSPAVRFSRE